MNDSPPKPLWFWGVVFLGQGGGFKPRRIGEKEACYCRRRDGLAFLLLDGRPLLFLQFGGLKTFFLTFHS